MLLRKDAEYCHSQLNDPLANPAVDLCFLGICFALQQKSSKPAG